MTRPNPTTTPQDGTGDEAIMDAAVADALGSATSADYALLAASASGVTLSQLLKETTARMAAASPYMEPAEKVKESLLSATAPAAFKIEDYRRASRDDSRIYRWGLIAATLFLVAAAYYNIALQNTVKSQQQQLSELSNRFNDNRLALGKMTDPSAESISITHAGKVVGKAILDDKDGSAVVVLPANMIPTSGAPQLVLTRGGIRKQYHTVMVPAMSVGDGDGTAVANRSFELGDVRPDTQSQPKTASLIP